MTTWNSLGFYAIWLVLITICYSDIRYRIISNKQVIVLLIIILLNYFLGHAELSYFSAIIALVIGIVLFYIGAVGAGDVKLISVLLLSIPSNEISDFLVIMALLGIPLALIALIKKIRTKTKTTIPYGVAISLSYIIITSQILYIN
ncbi:prepilin peptidase [Orbus sturtevantii]|uniref:A24 family peptidase n=1 Tax=Orbus sturtevantii TaxID=3074109 RepID=UPI00370D0BAD